MGRIAYANRMQWLADVRRRAQEHDLTVLLALMASNDPDFAPLWRAHMQTSKAIYEAVQERAELLITQLVRDAGNDGQ